jgi:hypothetical protein
LALNKKSGSKAALFGKYEFSITQKSEAELSGDASDH